jgi:uncharacterized protein YozE (UPF0346 family)
MESSFGNMTSFLEWIQQWKFSDHKFNDLAYEINHRWTTFPSRNDLNNHHYLRSWLENNGASENMLMIFDQAWNIYEQEKDQHSDRPGTKIKRIDISVSKRNGAFANSQSNGTLKSGPEHRELNLSLSKEELTVFKACLDLTYDYVHWRQFSGIEDSRYTLDIEYLNSIRNKLESVK